MANKTKQRFFLLATEEEVGFPTIHGVNDDDGPQMWVDGLQEATNEARTVVEDTDQGDIVSIVVCELVPVRRVVRVSRVQKADAFILEEETEDDDAYRREVARG